MEQTRKWHWHGAGGGGLQDEIDILEPQRHRKAGRPIALMRNSFPIDLIRGTGKEGPAQHGSQLCPINAVLLCKDQRLSEGFDRGGQKKVPGQLDDVGRSRLLPEVEDSLSKCMEN